MASKLYVVVGAQYGSEAKGAVTGRICSDESARGRSVVNVRVGGGNAGHTVVGRCPTTCADLQAGQRGETVTHDVNKHPWRLRQVPVAAVTSSQATLVIAAGSEVDPDVLRREVSDLDAAGYGVTRRLIVDRSATLLEHRHILAEGADELADRIGSTAKGIGAARSERIWRRAKTWGYYVRHEGRPDLEDIRVDDTQDLLYDALREPDWAVVIEGTQGYGLGLHTDNYPQVTSGDCRAIDFMAQAGISPWATDSSGWGLDLKVVLAIRPHPIRVAGNSGNLIGETTWAELGLTEERTTVTNKVRRVGAWDSGLVRASIRANGGPRGGVVWAAMTMWDTVCPPLAGVDRNASCAPGAHSEELFDSLSPYLSDIGISHNEVGYLGTGPGTAIVNNRMYQ